MKTGKNGREDLLINELFVNAKDILCPYICNLFNFIFKDGVFPEAWTEGLLVPLHKKGDINLPDNYRGITLLSSLRKLFTRVINNRLESWAEEYGVYIEAHYGFRKGRGTVDCIFVLSELVNNFVNSGKKLYSFFVDFRKAFDFVVRDNLWYKLLCYGVNGNILKIIMSMYRCVKTKIYVNGQKSQSVEYKLGVRQRECLSPFVFAMYINDMECALSRGNTGVTIDDVKLLLLFYADDAVIFAESIEELQNDINILHDYCNRWKLMLNTEKSQIVCFRKGRRSCHEKWKYGEKELNVVTSLSYLGIRVSAIGSFHQAQKNISHQICHQGFEDEFHFVCVCPACVHIRKKYIKQYYWKRPSMFKLVQLFNTENRKALNGLAKYVYQAFNVRNELTKTWKMSHLTPSCSFGSVLANDFGNCDVKFVVYISLSNTCCYVIGMLKL